MTPTAHTLPCLRGSGYQVATVERWIPRANVRSDLRRFADVVAAHPIRREILLVQVTTAGHMADRMAKAKRPPKLAGWLRAGGLFQVHGWQRRGGKWLAKVVAVQADDLAGVVVQALLRRSKRTVERDMFAG
jgi:hypothetical protein